MKVIVNGEGREVEEGASVADLVRLLGRPPERVAVELNREVVRRALWAGTKLRDGDRVEVVHFVGGGAPDC
ncbi:MAG TPA: sulfur carrier protein ThiS [Pyrinomonadaceae bacterium]